MNPIRNKTELCNCDTRNRLHRAEQSEARHRSRESAMRLVSVILTYIDKEENMKGRKEI